MKFAYFMGHVCTANDDGSIPLDSKVVAFRAEPSGESTQVLVDGSDYARLLNAAAEAGVPLGDFITDVVTRHTR